MTTPGTRQTVPFFLEEDQGQCTFTLEQLQETFGEDVSFTFDNCPSLGNDIDTYLLNSFRMAALVNSWGKESSENQYATFHPHKEGDNVCILLLYDGTTHLMGYFIGLPQEEEDGRWRMDVTLCSYEFSSLYRQQLEEYPRGGPQLFTHFIPLDDLEESGAVWCLRGYETSTTLTVQPLTPSAITCAGGELPLSGADAVSGGEHLPVHLSGWKVDLLSPVRPGPAPAGIHHVGGET